MTSVVQSDVAGSTPDIRPAANPVERASKEQRTIVIVLAQIVALAVIATVWSILRSRRK